MTKGDPPAGLPGSRPARSSPSRKPPAPPCAGPGEQHRLAGSGLWVAEAAGHALGLHLPADTAPRHWTDRHVAVYLIDEDYMPVCAARRGAPYAPAEWTAALLNSWPRDQLLAAACAALAVARGDATRVAAWTSDVLANLPPDMAQDISSALRTGPPTRVLLVPQSLLRAVKMILLYEPQGGPRVTVSPATAVTLLSHLAAREPTPTTTDTALLGGQSEALAAELVSNSLFNHRDDAGDLLARHRQLWNSQTDGMRQPPRAPLRQMLTDAIGLDLDDLLTFAFACYAQTQRSSASVSPELDLSHLRRPQPAVDAFLARFATTPGELTEMARQRPGPWQLQMFLDRPLLRTARTSARVLDPVLLLLRVTSGLFWLVHDHEKIHHGEQAVQRWRQTYSELVERRVQDQLRALAPHALGDAPPTFFTEEDLAALGSSCADAGIDFGDAVLLVEVVQHQLTQPAREDGDPVALRADFERSLMKKAGQLDRSAAALLDRADHPQHPLGRHLREVWPVIVEGATFPVNIVTLRHVQEQCDLRNLFSQPEVRHVLIMNVDELDMVQSLVSSQGATVMGLLRDWQASNPELPLRNHLIERYGGTGIGRPAATQEALDEQFAVITGRLQHLP